MKHPHERAARARRIGRPLHLGLACTLLVVLIWIIVVIHVRFERAAEIQHAQGHNEKLAVAFEQYVIGTLREADMLTRLIADKVERSEGASDVGTRAADHAFANGSISAYVVANAQGAVLASSHPEIFVRNPGVSNLDWFRAHLAGDDNGLIVGRPSASRALGATTVPVSRRLRRPDGGFGGVVVIHFRPSRFTEFYKDAPMAGTELIALVGLDGVVRARRAGQKESFGENVSAGAVLSLVRGRPIGNFADANVIGDIARFYSVRSLPQFPLAVVVASSQAAVFDEVDARRRMYFAAAALLSVLIALLGIGVTLAYRRQQRMLDKILDSEERFRALGDVLPQLIWVTRPDGSAALLNQRWSDFTGKPLDDFAGDGWLNVIHPEDRLRAEAAWKRCIANETPYEIEYRMRRHDGEYRWILARAIPMRDPGGALIRWVGTCTDIEEQKRAVAAVREAQKFAQATIDALAKNIAVLDGDGRILAVNKAWRTFAAENGAAVDAVGVGTNYLAVCDTAAATGNADGAYVAQLLRRVASQELETAGHEYACHSASARRWCAMRITRFDGGKPLRLVVAHDDITTRKLAEIMVRESETRFKSISANIPGMVFELRRSRGTTSLTYVSDGASEVLHLSPAVLQERPVAFLALLDRDDARALQHAMSDSERTLCVWNWEGRIRPAGGTPKWINLRATPRRLPEGGVVWDGIVFDITRSKEVEESLIENRRLQQELSVRQLAIREEERTRIAREIHDELGQRLTVLRMDAMMLPKTLDDPSPALRMSVGRMRDSIDSVLRIVRNIAAELRPPVLDLGIVIAIEWLVEQLQARRKLECRFHNRAGNAVQLDEERANAVFRVAQESMTNVARHARATRVDVTLAVDDGYLRLEVADDGIGFAPHSPRSPKSFGLVGLWERAAMLNGDIEIDSAPGKGTTVRLRVPL